MGLSVCSSLVKQANLSTEIAILMGLGITNAIMMPYFLEASRLRLISYTVAPIMVNTMKIMAKAFIAGLMNWRSLVPM